MANLTQLKILEELDGFLLVDKPAGIAFSTVVKTVKRKFGLVKVGHGGSLDAMASGLFILLLNDANKFVGDVMGADRAYEGRMRLGLKTNTGDIYGEKLAEVAPTLPDPEQLAKAVAEFKGDIFQVEPRFCSVRRENSAGYEVADTGEHTQFLSHVYRLDVDLPKFSVVGSKSLLVRSLVNDFGDMLGCGAALESVRRLRIGRFGVEKAISFERLLEVELKDFASCVMPLRDALQ